ncbi:ABC transporter substrate-binding protein [Rhizobium sp. 2YAF20]|uniref:ABC transporter substrate-binding protein n=1 Tax=Rhizobium sp. 2YAF20 TaxID=3233027 RepID=UPI003F9E402B
MVISRRNFLSTTVAASAVLTCPGLVKSVFAAAESIKIGVPTGITGNWSALGLQIQRACKLFEKATNADGGIDGRQVQFFYEDTQGDPATCVRKTSELIERNKINLVTGIISSPESLAVMPRLEEWNALYVASVTGVGSITAKNFVPNAFRSCSSGPMRARTIALWLAKGPEKRFFSIAQDYAWGKTSVETFGKLLAGMNKEQIGSVLTPLGAKDYSSYIAKIREANPEVLYVAMSGDDATAFLKQAAQYRLSDRMKIITEVLDLLNTKPLGEVGLGLTGVSQYNFGYDTPKNAEFVKLFKAEYGDIPDTWEGESWQALQFLREAILRAKSTDTAAVRAALEGLEIDSVKGKVTMRACDHQAEQQVFMATLENQSGLPYPTPKIIQAFASPDVVPECRKDSY